ncbi:hypothetical protein J27TS7_43020 [Paenibacillus dendritiformis]|nr:hypothetical protein J27TS7_43020 [Paenibacillus dendritiformis]
MRKEGGGNGAGQGRSNGELEGSRCEGFKPLDCGWNVGEPMPRSICGEAWKTTRKSPQMNLHSNNSGAVLVELVPFVAEFRRFKACQHAKQLTRIG